MKKTDCSMPVIPGYTIESILGTGGFATVYLAKQHTLQRDVALKVMNPQMMADEDFCARFLREAQDTATVSDHPNIVTVHDVGQVSSCYYIAMQCLQGPNLKQRIEIADDTLEIDGLLYGLAQALSYVHQKGFIHRDIKPANVLFTEAGAPVLSDFGVARMHDHRTQLTHQGTIVGTARYMSPEQSRGDPEIDARSDLYSLGVVLFEVLTSHPPFEASDPMALMLKHLNEPIPTLPGKYSFYQPVLNKLMAKQVNDRYESANELLEALSFLNTSTSAMAHNTIDDSTSPRASQETPTSTVIGAALGILLLLTGSVVFLYAQNSAGLPRAKLRCPVLTQTQEFERDALLQLAQVHHDIGRLAHPPGANALEAYTLALDIDPCNPRILDAVAQIRLTDSDAP